MAQQVCLGDMEHADIFRTCQYYNCSCFRDSCSALLVEC